MSTASSSSISTRPIHVTAIRHATSAANEFMKQPGNEWGAATFRDDPSLTDAGLSDAGRTQVEQVLRPRVRDYFRQHNTPDDWLILVSPLTRCLQTWQYGIRPVLSELFPTLPQTIVLPLLRERLYTASDTGRVRSVLQQDFADCTELDWSHVPEKPWWYTSSNQRNEWRPHGQGQYYAVPGEPLSVFTKRLEELDEWLLEQNCGAKHVLMVTHWGVVRHFTDQEVENCGLCSWECNGTTRKTSSRQVNTDDQED
jgi:broad specificity phosphatase PhoE